MLLVVVHFGTTFVLYFFILIFLIACDYFQYVLNVSFQFTVNTRSGLVGLSVVSLAVQETKTVLVPAQIHGQHMEDEDAAALGQVKKHGLVTLSGAQVLVHARLKTCLERQFVNYFSLILNGQRSFHVKAYLF